MEKMSKGRRVLFLAALFLTNVAIMADVVVIPVADQLFETFENVSLVNFILSGPSLLCVFGAILAGKLMERISKRNILIVSFAVFALSAIFGASFDYVYYVLALRGIVGLSWGMVNASGVAIIAEVFLEEEKRSSIMGLYNAAQAGCGAVLGLFAGFFAQESWKSVFRIYWVAVPIFVLLLLFLPRTEKISGDNEDGNNAGQKPVNYQFLKNALPLCLAFFMFSVIYMVIYYQISLYVMEKGLGTAILSGTYTSLATIGSCSACVLFGFIYAKLKRKAVIISYALLVVGYVGLYFTGSALMAGVLSALLGAAFGNGLSYYFTQGTIIVPEENVDFCVGLVTASNGLGMFLSTYAASWLQSIMGVDTITAIMPILSFMALIGMILSIVLTVRQKKIENIT